MPDTLTRSPTWLARFILWRASTTSMVFEPLCRKPDFQLRPFGASSPEVFFSRNAWSSCTRHPSIVAGSAAGAALAASAPCGFAATFADTTVVFTDGDAGLAVVVAATGCALAGAAALVGSDVRAAIRIAVPTMHTTMRPIAAVRLPVK